jgi:hypothetical protein
MKKKKKEKHLLDLEVYQPQPWREKQDVGKDMEAGQLQSISLVDITMDSLPALGPKGATCLAPFDFFPFGSVGLGSLL